MSYFCGYKCDRCGQMAPGADAKESDAAMAAGWALEVYGDKDGPVGEEASDRGEGALCDFCPECKARPRGEPVCSDGWTCRCGSTEQYAAICEECRHESWEAATDDGQTEGAAIAFGLMGMAFEIQARLGHAARVGDLVREMSKDERESFLDGLSEVMCLECGWLAEEYCNCDTNDSIDYDQ